MPHITITKESFDSEILSSPLPVLVDFWAEWCGPCKMIAPIFEELSEEYAGRVTFAKLNVDDEGELAVKYGVMGIPTMIMFSGGEEKERIVGARPADELADFIDSAIAAGEAAADEAGE